jgi:pimeloyl-ACP methyl ester carboxylesterase
MTAELVERLGLDEVTLVQNDHAAALALAGDNPRRIARLVVSACEAFENYPPGLPGKNLRLAAAVPGGLFAAMQAMRVPAVRHSPLGFGWLAKRPLPDELLNRWLRPPQTNPGVRRDLTRYARNARRSQMLEVCDRLRSFDRPVLVIWAPEDRV